MKTSLSSELNVVIGYLKQILFKLLKSVSQLDLCIIRPTGEKSAGAFDCSEAFLINGNLDGS